MLTTTEAGGPATFTVVLNSRPTASVTIPLVSSMPDEGTVTPASLTFTTMNWNAPQTVTVTGVDDPAAHPLAVRRHVRRTVAALRGDELLAAPVTAGQVAVVGALYDLATGEVALLPEEGERPNRPPG